MKKLRFLTTSLFLLGVLAFGSIFTGKTAFAADLSVLIPTERAVYQRNEKNKADLLIRVTYEADKYVTAVLSNDDNTIRSETVILSASADAAGIYEGTIPDVPAGGWYKLDIQAKASADGEAETSQTVEKIGVGEVFITAGQSNSCSFGETKTYAQEDMVSAFDPKNDVWQHCDDPQPCISGYSEGNGKGSPWPSAGDALFEKLQVPIGFVTTGFGGSTIAELLDKHYAAILDAIETLRPYGYRAVLLHQGEGDSGGGTKQKDYAESLRKLIQQTRKDAGYDLIWMVANAAYTPYTSIAANNEILEAQKEVCDEETIFLGPLTDDMDKDSGYRRKQDNLHFNEEGLKEHGRRWAESITAKLIPDYSKLPPDPTPEPPATSTPEPAVPSQPTPTPAPPVITNTPVPAPTAAPPEETKPISLKGKTFKNGMFQYKITADQKNRKKVKVIAINGKTKKSITIPKKVKYKGSSYQISAIEKKALTKLKKLKKLKTPSALYKTCRASLKGKKVSVKKY